MLIISNNIIDDLHGLEKGFIVRLNMAWVKNYPDLERILSKITDDVFLDYPDGRSKPPRPRLKLCHAVRAIETFPNIKYLAISNAEYVTKMIDIRETVNPRVTLVPKLESKIGVDNMVNIMKALKTNLAMLDKEDIYTSLNGDEGAYLKVVDKARKTAKKNGYELLELQGVIFRG